MREMISNNVNVQLEPSPDSAPVYGPDTKILRMDGAVVVGKGTVSGNPTIDLQLVDGDGNKYLVVTTGAIVEMLAGCVRGQRERTRGGA